MDPGQKMPPKSGKNCAIVTRRHSWGTIYSYNVDYSKTPGGIKVRWKVRVVTGPQAARYDARQAEAIREALIWAVKHQDQLRSPQDTP